MDRSSGRRWVALALLWGAVLAIAWMALERSTSTALWARVVRDGLLYLVGPAALARLYGRRLGWRVDRRALRNTLLLALFVLPFYLVGSSLPTVRAYYPMWSVAPTVSSFVPHAVGQFVVVLAAETYFRGLLCVGVREIGFKSVFISPVVYALQHASKPPIELLLSGPTDVLFGAVDYQSRSILPSVVAHGFGLTLLDWLVLHPPLLAPERVAGWLRWLPVPV
ncbi:abortive infection protein [Halococcus morrhuae DSM 1307]|uniref:Abortive infection protein n=2 Tax=Halococcus morrhuae TaxID=2250 RepID=M0MGT5_HALMO|nr:CPBP family intramembrane glutamic endopeptidase [Halococcus morrhuae]EMA44543.1 abortive infection protein [Halococcus morrhuae DSM 1307]